MRQPLVPPMRVVGFAALLLLSAAAPRFPTPVLAQATPSPTIDELVNLKRVASPALSPDGKTGRVHRARDQLGRERLRNRDLAGGRGGGRAAPADAGAEVEPPARVRARQPHAGIRVGPRRRAPDLSHRHRRRRSRAPDQARGRRLGLRVVARRQVDRLHGTRREDPGDEGPRRALGRDSHGGRGPALHPPLRARPRHARRPARSPGARSSSAASTGRRTARASPSTTAPPAIPATAARPTSRSWTSRRARARRWSRRPSPDSNPRWSPDGRRIAFVSSMAQAVLLLREQRHRHRRCRRLEAAEPDRCVRRRPVDRGVDTVRDRLLSRRSARRRASSR